MRDYPRLDSLRPAADRESTMRAAADALWELLGPSGVSWLGFYTKPADQDAMILGPNRPKPACSPLGLDGMCGRCWREERAFVVHDVRRLAGGYIACDPRDLSEVVVPLFDESGACYGVLDLDSHEVGAFDERDARELDALVHRLNLSSRRAGPVVVL